MDLDEFQAEFRRLVAEAPRIAPSVTRFEEKQNYGTMTDEALDRVEVVRWEIEATDLLGQLSQSGVSVFRDLWMKFREIQEDMRRAHSKSVFVHKTMLLLRTADSLCNSKLAQEPARALKAPTAVSGRKVFVVHGHDESLRESVARFLERLRLEAVILHEKANAGKTIIEKLEANASVSFAIVLLTPDDLGAVQTAAENLRPRARQNVVFELGYFAGHLGRPHVAALVKGDIELPSDQDGVLYVRVDDQGGGWQFPIAKELKAAGLDVDLNDLI